MTLNSSNNQVKMSHRRAVLYTLPMLSLGVLLGLSVRAPLNSTPLSWTTIQSWTPNSSWGFKRNVTTPAEPTEQEVDQVQVKEKNPAHFVSEQLTRTARYEDRLKKRLQALDAILEEVEKLDTGALDSDHHDAEHHSAQSSAKSHGRVWYSVGGVGGRENRLTSYSKATSKRRSAASKNSYKIKGTSDDASSKGANNNSSELPEQASPATPPEAEPITRNNLTSSKFEELTAKLLRLPLGAPVAGEVSSAFGVRLSPFTEDLREHQGIDFSGETASSVVATADGIVVDAGWKGAYGYSVTIKHGSRLQTLYGHLSKITVKMGDSVCRGQQIGLLGSSGNSTGPHVHYEVRVDNNPVNPAQFVRMAGFLKLLRRRPEA